MIDNNQNTHETKDEVAQKSNKSDTSRHSKSRDYWVDSVPVGREVW